ncbi:hypothetical protein BDP27DRAFT_1371072 [Rhodocollybia butyracea]|uniref:Uncharacterized protein n=1 Tax=Rhodocollybia butyracea TaxID=206335 RepID=A0A9P5TYH9_9AGAR|nr:hypothetical protein BDP27DRAFT_1371072 [Rhodocollybia butyracea]
MPGIHLYSPRPLMLSQNIGTRPIARLPRTVGTSHPQFHVSTNKELRPPRKRKHNNLLPELRKQGSHNATAYTANDPLLENDHASPLKRRRLTFNSQKEFGLGPRAIERPPRVVRTPRPILDVTTDEEPAFHRSRKPSDTFFEPIPGSYVSAQGADVDVRPSDSNYLLSLKGPGFFSSHSHKEASSFLFQGSKEHTSNIADLPTDKIMPMVSPSLPAQASHTQDPYASDADKDDSDGELKLAPRLRPSFRRSSRSSQSLSSTSSMSIIHEIEVESPGDISNSETASHFDWADELYPEVEADNGEPDATYTPYAHIFQDDMEESGVDFGSEHGTLIMDLHDNRSRFSEQAGTEEIGVGEIAGPTRIEQSGNVSSDVELNDADDTDSLDGEMVESQLGSISEDFNDADSLDSDMELDHANISDLEDEESAEEAGYLSLVDADMSYTSSDKRVEEMDSESANEAGHLSLDNADMSYASSDDAVQDVDESADPAGYLSMDDTDMSYASSDEGVEEVDGNSDDAVQDVDKESANKAGYLDLDDADMSYASSDNAAEELAGNFSMSYASSNEGVEEVDGRSANKAGYLSLNNADMSYASSDDAVQDVDEESANKAGYLSLDDADMSYASSDDAAEELAGNFSYGSEDMTIQIRVGKDRGEQRTKMIEILALEQNPFLETGTRALCLLGRPCMSMTNIYLLTSLAIETLMLEETPKKVFLKGLQQDTDPTRVLAQIHAFLEEAREYDASQVVDKIDAAICNNSTPSPLKPAIHKRTKHRSDAQNILARQVRKAADELLLPENQEKLVSIARRELDCTGLWTEWNQAAADVFTRNFMSKESNKEYNFETVKKAFRGHLTQLKKDFASQDISEKSPEEEGEERKQSAHARRYRLSDCRIKAFEREWLMNKGKEYGPALDHIKNVIYLLTVEVNSGDEADSQLKSKFWITKMYWRSYELEEFLYYLSALHLSGQWKNSKKCWKKGALPVARFQSDRPDTVFDSDHAPNGLPQNWYDEDWLNEQPDRRELLGVQDAVDLTLPPDILRTARCFLRVKTRKDVPLPANHPSII